MARTQAELRRTFDEAYERHRVRVYHWALRYGRGNTAWAEDLAHDVFARLWKELPDMPEQGDLGGWLYRVAANQAISKLRSERSFTERVTRLILSSEPAEVPGPENEAETKVDAQIALAALQSLPDLERVVLSMKYVDGLQQREIARAIGKSDGYVSKLVARGVERLRAAGWAVSHEQD